MNLGSILLWGFCATLVLTTCLAASQGLGLSRMSMPLILGAAFTGDRRRANLYGFFLHLANGCAVRPALRARLRELAPRQLVARGGHRPGAAVFILAVALPLLPYLHPRMATEDFGRPPSARAPASWRSTTAA